MARKNVAKAFDLWLGGMRGQGDATGSISSDGDVLYSYAMPLVARTQQNCGTWRFFIIKHGLAPTRTTATHLSQLRYMLACSSISTFATITDVSSEDLELAMQGGEALEDVIVRNIDAKAV